MTLREMNPDERRGLLSYSYNSLVDSLTKAFDLSIPKAKQRASALYTAFEENEEASPSRQYFWAIEVGGKKVGMLWLGIKEDQAYLWDIFINEDKQGQGFGKKAMQLMEIKVKALGANRIVLNVFSFNQVAMKLYEDLGYLPKSLRMEKSLQQSILH